MLKWVLIFVSLSLSASPPDSLRIAQLEGQLKQIELDKEKAQKEADRARIVGIEAQVQNMAKHQVRLDNDALWSAGDKIQSSIWLQLAGSGCFIIASLGAQNGNSGAVLLGLGGAITFDIMGVVKMFGAGEQLQRAANP